jgi:hypothetical protein
VRASQNSNDDGSGVRASSNPASYVKSKTTGSGVTDVTNVQDEDDEVQDAGELIMGW